jgi:hypothetical protein
MMLSQRGFDWHNLPAYERLGSLVHKRRIDDSYQGVPFSRGVFYIDDKIPRFTEDRQFLLDAYNFTLEDK